MSSYVKQKRVFDVNRMSRFLLTVGNIYTAGWVAYQIRPRTAQAWFIHSQLAKEPNPFIMVLEWGLLAAIMLLNVKWVYLTDYSLSQTVTKELQSSRPSWSH